METALARLAEIAGQDLGADHRAVPGAGAAGGLGFGLLAFCGATMRGGFEVVSEAIDLESKIRAADVVVTGEGSLDQQTLEGKAPAEVARMARKHGKRVFAVVGLTDGSKVLRDLFDGVIAVAKSNLSNEETKRQAPELLRQGAQQLAQLLGSPGAASEKNPN
jgi:glycerate kinase